MAERSRRSNAKVDKFEALRRARQGGSRDWKNDEGDIYVEVDENQYRSIVKGRLQEDDFVEDDGVAGYVDNGMDDWGEGDDASASKEEKPSKAKKKSVKSKPKPPPPPPTTFNDYKPKPKAAEEDDFMASIMNSMNEVKPEVKHSRKRKPRDPSPSPPSSPGASELSTYRRGDRSYPETSSDGPIDVEDSAGPSSDDLAFSPFKKHRTSASNIAPALEKFKSFNVNSSSEDIDIAYDHQFGDTSFDDLMDTDDFIPKEEEIPVDLKKTKLNGKPADALKKNNQTIKKEEAKAAPGWLSVHASLTVTNDDTFGPLAKSASSSASASKIQALEEDGSLRFFWLDYWEGNGNIYFIGKLKDKQSGAWISCCVTVENLQRNLFVLPRPKRLEDDHETDVVPSNIDVYKDFDAIRKGAGISGFKGKFVKRKYAFGEQDVPMGESTWLKVKYPFTESVITGDLSSPNIARIFGTNTNAFELLVLKRKIMGPCWLEIKNPHVEHKGSTWCKFEATVSDPKDINPFAETDTQALKEIPPLTIISLSVRTVLNHRDNKREIVCATARVWSNIQIDDPTPPDQLPCTVQTFVRPLGNFPTNFLAAAKSNSKGTISPESTERALLNRLLTCIYKNDPDVIVGHEFLGVTLDVLLSRMKELKADNWSRIGRFRRTKWPNIGRQGTNLRFLSGRLLCDLASDGAKSMISSTTWSLTEMCATHLASEREDIDPDETSTFFDGGVSSPDKLMMYLRHCELDAHYQMAIAAKVQILPLTKQLTNLAGNSWNKTLNGGRAERNEYILLHEFHRLKYVCPDKQYGKKVSAVVKAEAEEGDAATTVTGKGKRDKYKGGLVFEPKRGLWDKFVLVMDFNSLYPSIIQEYNIDFTTVDRREAETHDDQIPDIPPSDIPQGVLPRLIATLVNRRKQVKSLMKDKKAPAAKLLQWGIKQQALKLTANSMYGCLGFEYSRFYARPLAALTTFKGREILTQTKELAESLQLDVVYGDTDSVFVNSNVTDFSKALQISHEFKKLVNERYKLLEIDLDGVFKRLLLLQKKKYAALKMEDAERTSIEVKGLDMKRREYCGLSKRVSQYILDQVLSGEPTEIVVENIHEYLTNIGESVRSGKVGIEEFVIFKRLGKNPEDYPDAKNQPHVTVALRMKTRGGTARAGDVIPYIFCLGEDGQASKTAQANKARHPDEIRKAAGTLQIDFEHYLTQQILPPVERLCEPIEGTDRARLAECLGLDAARYRSTTEDESRTFGTLESQMSDAARFKDTDPLRFICRKCHGEMAFSPIAERQTSILHDAGPQCAACQEILGFASMQMQLEAQIREHINRYYEGWMVCDEPLCRSRSRSMSVYGWQCLKSDCRGNVSAEYSDVQLYTQLLYYKSLFDRQRVETQIRDPSKRELVKRLTFIHHEFLDAMAVTVEKHLEQSGRRFVNLGNLFSFMKL